MLRTVTLVTLIALAAGQATWKDCSKQGAHAKVSSVDISPNPPQKGSTSTIVGKGSVDETVTSGTYTLEIKFAGIKVLSHTHSICGDDDIKLPLGQGDLKVHGLKCPQAAGDVTIEQDLTLTSSAPTGTYTAEFTSVDQNGNELICLDLTMPIA